MADDDITPEEEADLEAAFSDIQDDIAELSDAIDDSGYDLFDEVSMLNDVYYIHALWADMHVHLITPYFEPAYPPKIIEPGVDSNGSPEHVYAIFDYGDRFSTSVDDIVNATRSTGKYLNTIDKMIQIVIERCKAADDWDDSDDKMEMRVAFEGHEIGQRKAFNDCIMSQENIVVTNFEPGEWGERQIRTMEHRAEKGFLKMG